MPRFHANRRLPHSADQMFDLVADVERYPEFVPLCRQHIVVLRKQCGDSEELLTDMTVAYQVFSDTLRSRVTLDRTNGRILIEAIDGPLRRLQTRWTFQRRGEESCDVGFDLSYEFTSSLMALLLGTVFDAAFSRFAQAFEHRANIVYGHNAMPSNPRQHKIKSPAQKSPMQSKVACRSVS